MSDNATEADIAAKRPPSYQVIMKTPDGWRVMTDDQNRAMRFRPDPKGAQAQRADQRFMDTRAGMEAVRQENESMFGSRDGAPGVDMRGNGATTGGSF